MSLEPIDYEEIRQLLARYDFALDFCDAEAYVDCFTPDGAFTIDGMDERLPYVGRHRGAVALRSLADRMMDVARGYSRHWNNVLLIEGDGHTAEMRSYVMVVAVGVKPDAVINATGVYRDRLRKVDGRWRFEERRFTCDPQPEHRQNPPAETFADRTTPPGDA